MTPLPAGPHIIWSCDPAKLDAGDPWTRRYWIGEVLVHGRMEDVRQLDWNEVRALLPQLRLPSRVRKLWEYYFAYADAGARPHPDPARRP